MERNKIIVVLGPTASGKSDLAVQIARRFNGEIISADSRQVYKGLDIGTGKITKREMQSIPHHLLSVASPKRTFTVADYKRLGEKAIKKIIKQNKIPIICGGTGFYIDTLLYGYSLPEVPPQKELREKLDKESVVRLFSKLEKLDPDRAKTIDRFNKRRLIRALEIIISSGKPVPPLQKESRYDILKIGIERSKEELKSLIRKRLLKRIKQGMVGEVRKLKKNGLNNKRLEELGLEYRYINRFLNGKISKTEMVDELEKEIFSYAKRQMTWFGRDKKIHWIKDKNEAIKFSADFIN